MEEKYLVDEIKLTELLNYINNYVPYGIGSKIVNLLDETIVVRQQ